MRKEAGRVGSVIAFVGLALEYRAEADPATMILWVAFLILMRTTP